METDLTNNNCTVLYYKLMRTQQPIFMLIAVIFSMIQPTNAVDPNCLTFVGNTCTACNNVTQLYFGWCWPLDAKCQTFAESGCAVCKSGFQLLQGWCYSPDPDCYIFSTSGVCTLCNSGGTFYLGQCINNQFCKKINSSVCTACKSGYYLDDNYCYQDSVHSNCRNLTSNGCIACQIGYQLSQDRCYYPLDSNCNAFSGSKCISCKSGYQLYGEWCQKKDYNCKSFNGSICTFCIDGYYLVLGWCYIPDPQCQTQNPSKGCILCNPGYYIRNELCDYADPNCQILTPLGCNLCIFGYYLSYGFCYSLCEGHDSTGACNFCYTGYILIGDLCVPTNTTVPCLYFSSKGFCHLCPTNYTLYDGKCYTTISNCQIYTITGSCRACEPGYTGDGSYCAVCSSVSQSSNGNCLSVGGGISSININGSFVPCGPGCRVCSSIGLTQVTCITPQKGYYLAGGVPTKCLVQTCLTCVPGTSTCKSCFDGYTLVLGNCVACLDPNAIYCSPTNINSSKVCSPKYTIVISNNSVGYCQPCAANCFKCDVSGAGNCESSQCMLGYVQLIGTLNCTVCIGSCPVCDANNPNTCLGCGVSRYNDGQGSCLACSSRCLTCTSDTNCSICQSGSTLIDAACYQILGYPCAIMGSKDKCSQCFQGYTLNGSSICVLALASNGTYTNCPYGYYLSNSSCLSCPASNCQACTTNVSCALCVKGYYVKAGVCLPCSSGCRDCFSATSCNQAADGYYLQNGISGVGKVSTCKSPCQMCEYSASYCLACFDGYNIEGNVCISSSVIIVQIVFGAGNSISIFSNSDSKDTKLFKSIKSMNRLLNSFCLILQSSLIVNDSSCKDSFRLKSLASGSVLANLQVDENMVKNVSAAKNSIYLKLFSQGIDGATVISATITSTHNNNPLDYSYDSSQSSSSSASNMPLILGVVIGVGFLVITIIIVFIIKRRKNQLSQYTPKTIEELMQQNGIISKGEMADGPQFSHGPALCSASLKLSQKDNVQNNSDENAEDINDALKDIILTAAKSTIKKPKQITSKRVKKLEQFQLQKT